MPLYNVDNDSLIVSSSDGRAKQSPGVINRVPVRKAIQPTKEIIYRRPDHVVLNNTGSYAFLYATTGW